MTAGVSSYIPLGGRGIPRLLSFSVLFNFAASFARISLGQ